MMDFMEFEALRSIGLTAPIAQQLALLAGEDATRPMRVLEIQREHLLLHDGHAEHRGRPSAGLLASLQAEDDALAVGDWVLVRPEPQGTGTLLGRVPPLTQLSRRVNDGRGSPRRQVLVSNVDTALLVMGLDHDFNLRRLERYLALVRLAGVEPVLLLSKADLLDLPALARRLAQARQAMPAGAPVFALDTRDASIAERLQPWLVRGRTLVLLGSSGAGKSTLTNTLVCPAGGEPGQRTGAVRAGDDRGRHTTTVRSLRLTPQGACLIDTPGLRALRLDVGDEAGLDEVFADIAQWAGRCRFRDCRHQDEPGCAVREAVPAERVRNFHKLQREARRDTMTALQRREEVAHWKARGRVAHQRLRAKRGDQ